MHVRLRNYFQKRHPGAVKVNQRTRAVFQMGQFSGVFFHMNSADTNTPSLARIQINIQPTVGRQRQFILADLIGFRQIGIEVVFTGKDILGLDGTVEGQRDPHGKFHSPAVDDRQHAGHTQTYRTNGRIRWRFDTIYNPTAAKHLRFGHHFGVDFQADNRFIRGHPHNFSLSCIGFRKNQPGFPHIISCLRARLMPDNFAIRNGRLEKRLNISQRIINHPLIVKGSHKRREKGNGLCRSVKYKADVHLDRQFQFAQPSIIFFNSQGICHTISKNN